LGPQLGLKESSRSYDFDAEDGKAFFRYCALELARTERLTSYLGRRGASSARSGSSAYRLPRGDLWRVRRRGLQS
jgi:hypothetical protein